MPNNSRGQFHLGEVQMSLTLDEAKLAADTADAYPSGVPMGLWGSHPIFRDTPFPKRLEAYGCPSFRIAVRRENEGKPWDPLKALVDVANAAGFTPYKRKSNGAFGDKAQIQFSIALAFRPKEIAVRLRAYKPRKRRK